MAGKLMGGWEIKIFVIFFEICDWDFREDKFG